MSPAATLQELVKANVELSTVLDEALKGKGIAMVCVLVKGHSFTYSTNVVNDTGQIAEILQIALKHFEGKK